MKRAGRVVKAYLRTGGSRGVLKRGQLVIPITLWLSLFELLH